MTSYPVEITVKPVELPKPIVIYVKESTNLQTLDPKMLDVVHYLHKFNTTLTSGDDYKKHAKNSKHYRGLAVDYRFRPHTKEGLELADFFESDEGQAYLSNNCLFVMLECPKRSYYKYRKKYPRIIKKRKNLSAIHLHLELRNNG